MSQQQGKTIPAKFFREEVVLEDLSMSDLGLAIISVLEEQLQASVRIDCLGVIKSRTPNSGWKTLKHKDYPIIGDIFDKHIQDEIDRGTKESEIRSQSTHQRLADAYAEQNNLPTAIFVADEWQAHLGFNDEIPKPNNFKHPDRCHIIYNVKAELKEWRQYLGAGQTCMPEIS